MIVEIKINEAQENIKEKASVNKEMKRGGLKLKNHC